MQHSLVKYTCLLLTSLTLSEMLVELTFSVSSCYYSIPLFHKENRKTINGYVTLTMSRINNCSIFVFVYMVHTYMCRNALHIDVLI